MTGLAGDLGAQEWSYERAFVLARLSMALAAPNLDGSGAYRDVNQAFADLFGYSREDLVGMDTRLLTHPDDAERTADGVRRMMMGLIPILDMEKRFVRRDGSVFWGEVHASLLPDADGEPTAAIVHIVNIDDRKRAELELARYREQLAESQQHANTGSFELTSAGLLLASEQLTRMSGRNPRSRPPTIEQVIERMHPADRDRVWSAVLRPDRSANLEFRYQLDDGRELLLEATLLPVPDAQGLPGAMRGTIRDVTLKRTLERALGSAERIQSAFDASPVPHLLLGDGEAARRIEYPNDAATLLVGRTCDDLVGAPLATLFPAGQLPPTLATVLDAGDGGCAGTLQVLRSDGRLISARVEVRSVAGGRTTERSFLVALQDPAAWRAGTPADGVPALTTRELEVLQLVADGRGGGEIADMLHLSAETVKTHLRRVYAKFGVGDRAAAVAVAFRAGIIR